MRNTNSNGCRKDPRRRQDEEGFGARNGPVSSLRKMIDDEHSVASKPMQGVQGKYIPLSRKEPTEVWLWVVVSCEPRLA